MAILKDWKSVLQPNLVSSDMVVLIKPVYLCEWFTKNSKYLSNNILSWRSDSQIIVNPVVVDERNIYPYFFPTAKL